MAGVTTAIIGGVSAASKIFSTVKGISDGKRKKEQAAEALAKLKVPELRNPYKDIQINTAGADLIREESGRTSAGLIEAARQGGARGIASSIPQIMSQNNIANQQGQQLIDSQIQARDTAIARGEESIMKTREQRYTSDIEGIGAMYSQGDQQYYNGINSIGQTISSVGRAATGIADAFSPANSIPETMFKDQDFNLSAMNRDFGKNEEFIQADSNQYNPIS